MDFNPIKVGPRSTLVLLLNGPLGRREISNVQRISESAARARAKFLLDSSYVEDVNGKLFVTERGKEAVINAPVKHADGTIYTYTKAVKSLTPKIEIEIYKCPELGRNPGLPDERFEAFALPSRRGNWRIYPDGRKEICD